MHIFLAFKNVWEYDSYMATKKQTVGRKAIGSLRSGADRYLTAVDEAWNTYRVFLSLEAFAASVGWAPKKTNAVRVYLQGDGVL